MIEKSQKRRIGFNVEEASATESVAFIGRKHKIGFITDEEDAADKTNSMTSLVYKTRKDVFSAMDYFRRYVDARKMLCLLAIVGLLSSFAEKETQNNGKASLAVGSFGVPIVKAEMNSGNKDTDFKAKMPLTDRFRKMVKEAQEIQNRSRVLPQKRQSERR